MILDISFSTFISATYLCRMINDQSSVYIVQCIKNYENVLSAMYTVLCTMHTMYKL